jgi:hypothetical protein
VEHVDTVTGVGWDRADALGSAGRYFDLRRIVTNLCVMDFGGPSHRLRLVSVHPGVSLEDVIAATGFELAVAEPIEVSRTPDANEEFLIREVIDPSGARERELPDPA